LILTDIKQKVHSFIKGLTPSFFFNLLTAFMIKKGARAIIRKPIIVFTNIP